MDIIIIPLIIVIFIIAGILFWLIKEHSGLKKKYLTLINSIEQNNRDIAGLCSAAVSVDTELSENAKKIQSVLEKVVDFEQQHQQTTQPYFSAIQMVRNGTKAEELIQQCGLSREEALLLIRMHSQEKK